LRVVPDLLPKYAGFFVVRRDAGAESARHKAIFEGSRRGPATVLGAGRAAHTALFGRSGLGRAGGSGGSHLDLHRVDI